MLGSNLFGKSGLVVRSTVATKHLYIAASVASGLVLCAGIPIVLPSRADGALSRFTSAAMAQLFIHYHTRDIFNGRRSSHT